MTLLSELKRVTLKSHQMPFSDDTALAKSHVKIMRMSEDVDIKLIPNKKFNALSRSKKKIARKILIKQIECSISQSHRFSIENRLVFDEYRYVEYEVKYPQQFNQLPCLRPIIKLELMETISLLEVEERNIQSLVAELYQQPKEISAFPCVSIQVTLVEKVLSMLRRIMLAKRDADRKEDVTLVRHIYDIYCIDTAMKLDIGSLTPLFRTILQEDIERFGNQHPDFVANPAKELHLGLQKLENNPLFRQHFKDFVTPMVFNQQPNDFDICFASFKRIAQSLINKI